MDWIEPILKTWMHIGVGLVFLWCLILLVVCGIEVGRDFLNDLRGR